MFDDDDIKEKLVNEDLELSDKIYTLDEIKEIVYNVVKDKPVYEVILFGSYAKNNADEKSDLDFIIDSNDYYSSLKIFNIISDMELAFKKAIDLYEKSGLEFNHIMKDEIEKNGIVIYEDRNKN